MNHMTTTSRPTPNTAPRSGFTIVELLVVIVLIVILSTFLLIGLSRGFGAAKRASSQALVQTLGQGVESFYNDFNFHPPLVIGQASGGITTPQMQGNTPNALANAMRDARAHSEWTLPIYLLGAGDINADGSISQDDTGAPELGIRDPGRLTRAWRNENRNNAEHRPPTTGRVYGPYIEPGSLERYLETVRVTADATSITPNQSSNVILYRIRDPFDVPVRYYHNWRFRNSDGEVDIRLAPIELRSAESVRDQIAQGDSGFDAAADRHIVSSPFAILSAGASSDQFVDRIGNQVPPFGDVVIDPGTSDRILLPYRYDQPITRADLPDTLAAPLAELLETNVRFAQ